MKELTNSQAIIALVLILWAIVIGYYLVNIFKGMNPVSKIELPDKKGLNSIEVNDEENLSTEHKSFLNIVRSETYSHNNQKN